MNSPRQITVDPQLSFDFGPPPAVSAELRAQLILEGWTPPLNRVTRVEIISRYTREMVRRDVRNVTSSLQDDGRTLKVFMET